MGKRYYCDYCDRSFQDTLHNRKKHLNGVQHQRAKKAWLDNFRDTAAILQDERAKPACRKFLQTGTSPQSHRRGTVFVEARLKCPDLNPIKNMWLCLKDWPWPENECSTTEIEAIEGQCVFGHNCRYSHLSEMDIKALEQQIEDEKWQKMMPHDKDSEPSVEEWLSRREKKKAAMTSGSVLKMEEEEAAENSDVPLFLRSIPDLPPSLLPPHPGGWRASVHSDWG